MSPVPTKRLLVYVALGLVVLIVGVVSVVSLRGGEPAAGAGLVVTGPGSSGTSISAPTTTAAVTTTAPAIYVQVAGAVARPGVFRMEPGSRVFQAIEMAGGFDSTADQQTVSLAVQLTDGSRVYVPKRGEQVAPAQTVQVGGGSAGITGTGTSGSGSGAKVMINSATAEELDTLPGVGPALAKKIIAYRDAHGPFTSVDQLSNVSGIGPSKLEQIKPLVGL
jgi:competence protein ComEA